MKRNICSLKRVLVIGFLSIVIFRPNAANDQNQKSLRPNVIIVLTDDQGYGDFSVHGNPILKKPAFDKMWKRDDQNFLHPVPTMTTTFPSMLLLIKIGWDCDCSLT
jgi:hypothetical protein